MSEGNDNGWPLAKLRCNLSKALSGSPGSSKFAVIVSTGIVKLVM
jgi:hypothetical protein